MEIIITALIIIGGYMVYKEIRLMRVRKTLNRIVDEMVEEIKAECDCKEAIEAKPVAKKKVTNKTK